MSDSNVESVQTNGYGEVQPASEEDAVKSANQADELENQDSADTHNGTSGKSPQP